MPPITHTATTRSARLPTHLLHTPDTFIRTPMPGVLDGVAIVHASPELAANFLCFTVELNAGGSLAPSSHNRFFFMLSGEATLTQLGTTTPFSAGSYAFHIATSPMTLTAKTGVRCLILDKRYEPLGGVLQATTGFVHPEEFFPAAPLNGDPRLACRLLMPADAEFDFAVNTMTYAPGAALPQVEIHYMEHACLMLEGEGLYLLNDRWYPVQAGDFIWMAPYCPQQFAATGNTPARYLIYKNFNRTPAL